MEWDFGAPWYRPTRINHVTSGSEFGWRHGTGKWPDYYEDSLPGILDIGPGSPTGIVAGTGLAFPERFQRAIFMLDWTYATIYAVHLTPAGSSWNAEIEEILSGKGLPLTDAVVGKDGALYFTVGGRRTKSALYRLSYLGNEPTAPVANPEPLDSKTEQLTALRHKLEALHLDPDPDSIDLIWNALENENRFLRFAARTALEHLPANIWQDRLQLENSNWQTIQAGLAAARTGSANDQSDVRKSLEQLDWEKLDESQKLNLLRAFGLSFIRHDKPSENLRKKLIGKFEPVFPAETDSLNRELVRMLVYLRSPQVLAQTLRLMETEPEPKAPAWSNLAARNDEYGSILIAMMENMPSEQNLFYAYALRTLEGPWNIDQRYQFFSWLSEAAKKSGGSSYRGFIADLRAETLKRATPEEREMIEKWDLESKANPFENLPKVEGPGRNWSVEEALASTEKGLLNRNLANGKNMFKATLCAACHRFNGEGGEIGPDLTTIGRRFTIADLIEKIIDPNRQISDQYAFELITLKDGSASTGKILEESAENLVLSTNPFDLSETRKIARSEVEKIETSPVSPMPPGLINRLNEEELRDLLAFLLQQR